MYKLQCDADDGLCDAELTASVNSVSDDPPETTAFSDVTEATDFVLELDGSCGYHFGKDKLSFQDIEYPDWDVSFCHEFALESELLDYLEAEYDLDMTFDCALYIADVDQTWRRSFLYDPATARAGVDSVDAPSPAD